MSKPINLGRKPGEDIEIHKLSDLKDKTFYPSLYLGDVDDPRLLDLPDEGTCVIKYKIRRKEHREVRRDGDKEPKRSCTLDMDVISLEPPPGKSYGNGKNGKKDKDDYDGGARKAFNDYFGK
jgi:hypothetical protein